MSEQINAWEVLVSPPAGFSPTMELAWMMRRDTIEHGEEKRVLAQRWQFTTFIGDLPISQQTVRVAVPEFEVVQGQEGA